MVIYVYIYICVCVYIYDVRRQAGKTADEFYHHSMLASTEFAVSTPGVPELSRVRL